MKKVIIASLYKNAGKLYKKVFEDIFDGKVHFHNWVVSAENNEEIKDPDLVLITSDTLAELVRNKYPGVAMLYLSRTFTKDSVDKLKRLETSSKVLLVNATSEVATETISLLYQLGVRHLNLIPYAPGGSFEKSIEHAITPGEMSLVPQRIKSITDIGDRLPDISTIISTAFRLGMPEITESEAFSQYLGIGLSSPGYLDRKVDESELFEKMMEGVSAAVDFGLVSYDNEGLITYINRVLLDFIGISQGEYIRKPVLKLLGDIGVSVENADSISEVVELSGRNLSIVGYPICTGRRTLGGYIVFRRVDLEHVKKTKNLGHVARYDLSSIVGNSSRITALKDIIRRISRSSSSVLITSETGTGKEIFAQAIHNSSLRKMGPFVAINCAALPESLLESELFGYEPHSFTGAGKDGKKGLFELADKGTIFLDEISEMPVTLQARLLRVLEEKTVMRVGGTKVRPVDFRVVSASNRNLDKLIEDGHFRKDLLYRLNVVQFEIPPLRERRDDINLLANHFIRNMGTEFILSEEVKEVFKSFPWDGNIRQLRNTIEYLGCLGESYIEEKHLPMQFFKKKELPGDIQTKVLKTLLKEGPMGRRKLSEILPEYSEGEIRACLIRLGNENYVEISNGRKGTKITEKGLNWLNGLPV